jgi:hypothetical protein
VLDVSKVANSNSVAPSSTMNFDAFCPAGTIITGGSCDPFGSAGVTVTGNAIFTPSESNSVGGRYLCGFTNNSGVSAQVWVNAMCARLAPAP